jgi:isoleucyl-tRNA synthetase
LVLTLREEQLYQEVDPKPDFAALEQRVLDFWDKNQVFEESIRLREGKKDFVFYDGPPFATGLPHFGHIVPGTIKDVIPRYRTMRGYRVERRFGWDCHGLPVEYEMEKNLGISGKTEIEQYGVAKFNESCRGIVQRYVSEWRHTVRRMGRWVDFDHAYKTMDLDFMESIWWVFKTLWEKGLIYEGYYILPYSPKLSTPLSNFEVNLGGYHDVHDPAITVRFKLKDRPVSILAWTTTPWTLPSNLGLAVGEDLTYLQIEAQDEQLILAEALISKYFPDSSSYKIVKRLKGKDLVGLSYVPLFPYFADLESKGAFRIHAADFVSVEEGTGIVHLAPGFGEDDYNTLAPKGIPVVVPLDAECRFTAEVPEYQGTFVKDADKLIIQRLKDEGKLYKRDTILHAYPHCYRTGAPLIYRAVSSWFVNIGKIKNAMIQANQQIHWYPEHIKNGRFGKWLEGARDWAISRNRYWGNPIPVWKCDKTGKAICVGSLDELEKLSGVRPKDLHKHYVDDITWPSHGGGTMRRVPEVLDCWFESGAMPYAQQHYPMENKEKFEKNFPADFINEGLDQTRGWFYTLTILAAALFQKPAFKSVIVSGIVLAEDGRKMSKSLRNYTDPLEVMNKFGADALRLFLMMSSVVKADDLRYSDEGVKNILRDYIIPLWNAYSFYVTYANIDEIKPEAEPKNLSNPLDAWILSEIESLTENYRDLMDQNDIHRAVERLMGFLDLMNNWYIRRSRRRFWKDEVDQDKRDAYTVLHWVLRRFILLAAPFIPFITETIYQNLKRKDEPLSVHLCDYPEVHQQWRDPQLEQKMALVRKAVVLGRSLRSSHQIKNRQPLRELFLVTRDPQEKSILLEMQEIIQEEINVKEISFYDNEEELVEYKAKANFKVLGKILGSKMKEAAMAIEQLSSKEIAQILDGSIIKLQINDWELELESEHLVVQRLEKPNRVVLNEGSLTVGLDITLTPELVQEGILRDFIRLVQNRRKEKKLSITDRIRLKIKTTPQLNEVLNFGENLLFQETLCDGWEPSDTALAVVVEMDDGEASFDLEKV